MPLHHETPFEVELKTDITQALNSTTVQDGLKNILPNHTGLWEDLRQRAS
ncbi:hypothetical protein BH23VER1_BH23VER1_32040 [soil metagenome]